MTDLIYKVHLNLFDNTQTTLLNDTTTPNDLSPEMKTYYSDYLIDNAEPYLIHDQFGQKHPIPANGGKTIEFRKYDPLPKQLTPLTEGVTPNGQKLNVTTVEATVSQYGGYVELSDVLLLTAIDNNLVMATELIGAQAGRTLDSITRNVLQTGTNVMYGAGTATSRDTLTASDVLTVDTVRKAVRNLEVQLAPKIDGQYVAIIHPDNKYDIMSDSKWLDVKEYSDPTDIYEGEIGSLYGVRFVETTEARVYKAGKTGNNATLDVYGVLFLGANAYGVTEVTGGGLQHIVKQLGSAGTADPLNQRATVGWKAIKTAEILVPSWIIRCEVTSSFNDAPANDGGLDG